MYNPLHPSASKRVTGFTLIELMVTLSLAAILMAIAVPNMRTFIQNNRLTAAANDLLRSFQLARTEAIKRQQNVVVCASADPTAANPSCSYGQFSGWIVFQDTNSDWQAGGGEPILERHGLIDSSIFVRIDNDGIESYGSSGFANPAGAKTPTRNVVICDSRGIQLVGANSTARAFLITATGRAHVSKDNPQVLAASAITGSCP